MRAVAGLLSSLLLIAVFQAHGSSVLSASKHEHSPEFNGLFDWLRENGAKVNNLKVDRVTKTGLRGVVATSDFEQGEVLARIPQSCTIDVGHWQMSGAELAVQLLSKQLEDPAWNKSFAPYFESLPEWGTLYSKEIWHLDPDHLELLQEPYLAYYVGSSANRTRDVWLGVADTEDRKQWPAVKARFPAEAAKIPVEQYRHYASLTATYSFMFPNAAGKYHRVLLPLLDLVNHRGLGSNAFVNKDAVSQDYVLVATKAIKAGEEVTHTYSESNERNDYSLINYFFLQRLDPPRLCTIDLPAGSLDKSFAGDDDLYLPRNKAGIQQYLKHLEDKLALFATTPAKDEKLLADRKLSWLERRIIEFRRERKLAMQHAIKRLREQVKPASLFLQMSEAEQNPMSSHSRAATKVSSRR